jgi:hypothetical protein
MARHYEPLVQVGFRTKKEVKEKIVEFATKENKGMSEYLAERVEQMFDSPTPNELEKLKEAIQGVRSKEEKAKFSASYDNSEALGEMQVIKIELGIKDKEIKRYEEEEKEYRQMLGQILMKFDQPYPTGHESIKGLIKSVLSLTEHCEDVILEYIKTQRKSKEDAMSYYKKSNKKS